MFYSLRERMEGKEPQGREERRVRYQKRSGPEYMVTGQRSTEGLQYSTVQYQYSTV